VRLKVNMCGFFLNINYNKKITEKEINQNRLCTNTLTHRGPDSYGEFINENIFVGHRRLSIIDLNNSANQPMVHESKKFILAFNGEIYNYLELKQILISKGYKFDTMSDTEVLLKGLIEWGEKIFNQLDGMFSGIFINLKTNKTIIFRDNLGQKPFYYFFDKKQLFCSSELRAIISIKTKEWRLNKASFYQYLMSGYYGGTNSPIEGIYKLEPGCYAEISQNNLIKSRFHKSIPSIESVDKNMNMDKALLKVNKAIDKSVEINLRSDVPSGVFLSGGIDSTILFDTCKKINPNIKSFSISFDEKSFDESPKVKEVISKYSQHEHSFINVGQEDMFKAFNEVSQMLDEPHGDPGLFNSYALTKNVKPHITVALSGDGGDELFAGYAPFLAIKYAKLHSRMPIPVELIKFFVNLLPENEGYMSLKFKAESFLNGLPWSKKETLKQWLGSITSSELSRLSGQKIDKLKIDYFFNDLFFDNQSQLKQTEVQEFLHFYQRIFLPEFVCGHTDKASMMNSLEVRAPFLSPSIIKIANSLPDRLKINNTSEKILLREILKQRGFSKNIYGQKKQGFTFPVSQWLRGSLKSRFDDLLNCEEWETDNLINIPILKKLKYDHISGNKNNYRILLNLMVFRAWRRNFPHIKVN
jgi:asparagine synthase (glutamine-hydrolysing)